MVINPIVGVYIPIIRIPIKGGMTIPNTMSLDPGTYGFTSDNPEANNSKKKNTNHRPENNNHSVLFEDSVLLDSKALTIYTSLHTSTFLGNRTDCL